MELFTSLLALVALAGAGVLALARLLAWRGHPAAGRFVAVVDESALWLAFVVAACSMAGSLYFSEVADFVPCRLCWYQRIAMYSSAVVLLVAAIRRDRAVRWYVGPLAGIGALISAYHYLIEWKPELGGSACDIEVSCTYVWFRELGFVTLAFMALCGFLAILVLVLPPATQPDEAHR